MLVSQSITNPYTSSATYPVSVADVKSLLRISGTDEDTLIENAILSATSMLENYCGRAFVTQTRVLRIDNFDNRGIKRDIYLSGGLLQSVTSVKFIDEDGTETVTPSTNYIVDSYNARINPKEAWYDAQNTRDVNACEVTYTCGYGNVADIPSLLKQAIGALAVYFYEARALECEIPDGIKKVANQFKVMRLGYPNMGIDLR